MSAKVEATISADASQFNSALRQANGAATNFGKSVASSVGGMVSGFLALNSIVSQVSQAIDHYSKVADISAKNNVTTAEVQRLGYVFEQSGSSAESAAASLFKFRQALVDAKSGSASATKVLLALGYSQQQISSGQIDATEAYYRTADAIANASDETDRLAIANAMFGEKLAGEVVTAMQQGSEAMKSLARDATVLSDGMVKSIDRSGDSLSKFKGEVQALAGVLTVALGAAIEFVRLQLVTLVEGFAAAFRAIDGMAEAVGNFSMKKGGFGKLGTDIAGVISREKDNFKKAVSREAIESAIRIGIVEAPQSTEKPAEKNKAVFEAEVKEEKAKKAQREVVEKEEKRRELRTPIGNDADALARVGLYAGGGAAGYQRTIADATMRTAIAVEKLVNKADKNTASTFSK